MSATVRLRDSGGKLRRFVGAEVDVQFASVLSIDNAAVVEGRTLFPSRVAPTSEAPRFLISGVNNSKVGKAVLKGPWKGMPIFTLTLEERATCPRSCEQWRSCYGSGMPWPKRWDHRDPDFMPTLEAEIITTARANPAGMVVRLHVLGDFYSMAYVEMWLRMIQRFPQLRVWGYTARRDDADDQVSREIATALAWMADDYWGQFAMRFSRAEPGPQRAVVVEEDPHAPDVIVCPAQTHATETCGTCGLCWSPQARDKTIAFLRHGMKHVKTAPADEAAPPAKRKYVVSGAGRPLRGGLPGETKEDRAKRVEAFMRENPRLTAKEVSARLGVPFNATQDVATFIKKGSRSGCAVFTPRQQWTPAKPPLATHEERLASIDAETKAQIAARYGAVFK